MRPFDGGAARWVVLVVGVALMAGGCGGPDGPARYDLSGKITHGGQPIPAGRIAFEPDGAKGNSGPPGYATIEDGQYATPSGRGTIGGPHRIRVTGFDGRSVGESPEGMPLFSEYKTTADLPKEAGTHDIDVPAGHK